ncbi:ABC-three component system middle component 6 [Pseudomonas sp. BLCC-B112]|uniref:ABC-three component system middle component 6 n=1 Tax=Pseudomonas sp. BLCC-B112 TaxID=3025319 RepID=UPI003FA7D908
MILPTKNISPNRALLTLAGKVFDRLGSPRTVSGAWDEFRKQQEDSPVSYAFFILAIDLLFLMKLVSLDDNGLISRRVGG